MPLERNQELIAKAIEAFQALTPIRLIPEPPDTVNQPGLLNDLGAINQLRLANGRLAGTFAIEVKPTLSRATIGQLYRQIRMTDLPTIVITDYVTPGMAKQLREGNILFMDAAGNAFITADNVFVHIIGQKRPETIGARKPPTQAFRAAGLNLILAILDDNALLNRPYRQIAEFTDVALGTITNVFTDLEELGHLQTIGDKRRLLRYDDLLHRWAAAYIEKVRDKQLIGRFTADDWHTWNDKDLERLGAYRGGEVAAQTMTGYLKPETTTLYLTEPPGRLQAEFGLRRNPNGPVELLRAFWPPGMHPKNQCAPPIIVYADLLTIGDDRTLETAKLLYEKHVAIDHG